MHSQRVEKLVKEPNHNAAKQHRTESTNNIKIKSRITRIGLGKEIKHYIQPRLTIDLVVYDQNKKGIFEAHNNHVDQWQPRHNISLQHRKGTAK